MAVLLLLVAGLLLYRQMQLRRVPDIGHPFDVEIDGTFDVDPSQNAAVDYEQLSELLVRSTEPDHEDLDRVFNGTWEAAIPAVRKWLDDNRLVLDRWRAATQKPFHLRVQPIDMTLRDFAGPVSDAMTFMRLARLAASRAEALGQLDDAWRWHRALFRYGRHRGMFDTSTERMIGAAIHDYAVRGVIRWSANERVTAAQLSHALMDVQSDYEMTPEFSVAIRAEYFITLDQLNHLGEIRAAYEEVNANFGLTDEGIPEPAELFLENEPELTRRLLRHQTTNLLDFVDAPESDQPPLLPGDVAYFDFAPTPSPICMPPSDFQQAVQRSSLARKLLFNWHNLRGAVVRERTRQAMLETALAAERYRRAKGYFSEAIADLVGAGLLDRIPVDPMSPAGESLRYERDPQNLEKAKIWSVGENRVDDGGSLAPVPYEGPADAGYWIGASNE